MSEPARRGPISGPVFDERMVTQLLAMAAPGALGAERLPGSASSRVFRVVEASMESVLVKIVPIGVAQRLTQRQTELGLTAGLLGAVRAGGAAGFGYLVFPFYVESLADQIAKGPLAAAAVSSVLMDVAGGLQRLHQLGYVHGDVKPGNVLITADAAVLGDLDDVASAGGEPVRMTPGFCPPEQLAGHPSHPSMDTYAFAAMVMTALTGSTAWMAAPAAWLAAGPRPGVSAAAKAALQADLDNDPRRRTVSPVSLLGLLQPSVVAEIAPPGSPAGLSPSVPLSSPRPGGGDQLTVAAQRTWGFVDLRAVTLDRPRLQVVPSPAADPDEVRERPIRLHPAMIASVAAALLLVVAGIVLTIMG